MPGSAATVTANRQFSCCLPTGTGYSPSAPGAAEAWQQALQTAAADQAPAPAATPCLMYQSTRQSQAQYMQLLIQSPAAMTQRNIHVIGSYYRTLIDAAVMTFDVTGATDATSCCCCGTSRGALAGAGSHSRLGSNWQSVLLLVDTEAAQRNVCCVPAAKHQMCQSWLCCCYCC